MSIMALVAAFGGGLVGAYMGALPAFIMTGFFALIGGIATASGADGSFAVNLMAFGSFLGPHVAFVGGVAASAYAGKQKKLEAGNDITTALNGLGAPDVLLVGGVFGVLGFLIHYVISITPLGPMTDLPGITVFILGVVCRLVFGSTGLTGKYTGNGTRAWFSTGNGFVCNLVLGAGVGIVVSFIAATVSTTLPADQANTILGIYPIICFGFSAVTLIFAEMGCATPGTHHITLPAALAAVAGIGAFGAGGAVLGVVFGILGSLLGDLFGNTLNSYCDSHIDPPATTIFLLTIVVSLIKMAL